MKRIVVGFVLFAACRPQTECRQVEVPQSTLSDRVETCRSLEMHSALSLCAQERAVYPSAANRHTGLASSFDMSTEDCLREWVKVFDACDDQPDREYRCAAVPDR